MTLALVFTATLAFSIAGIVALLTAKRFEMTTGRVVFGEARPRIGAFFHTVLIWVERVLPFLVRRFLHWLTSSIKWMAHYAAAHGVLALERALERGLSLLRYTTEAPPAGAKEASAFLKEVAEHKRKLLKRSRATRLSAEL